MQYPKARADSIGLLGIGFLAAAVAIELGVWFRKNRQPQRAIRCSCEFGLESYLSLFMYAFMCVGACYNKKWVFGLVVVGQLLSCISHML
jgi:hypothetical protein